MKDMIIIDDPRAIVVDERGAYLPAAFAANLARVVIADAPSSAMTSYNPQFPSIKFYGSLYDDFGAQKVEFDKPEPVAVKIANRKTRRRNAAKARRSAR